MRGCLQLLLLITLLRNIESQELLGASHGFPSFEELAGVIADEGELVDRVIVESWQHPSSPSNISSRLSGAWLLNGNDSLPELPLLAKKSGRINLHLISAESSTAGVHYIEGEAVLREGSYVSQDDIELKLVGVYVAEVGRLHARLFIDSPPAHPQLEQTDVLNHSADYRLALRHAARKHIAEADEARHQPHDDDAMRKTCEFALEARLQSVHQKQDGSSQDQDDSSQSSRHLLAKAAEEVQEAIMNGTLVSSNCRISMRVNASTYRLEKQYAKAVNYTLVVTGLSLIQLLLLMRQMEATSTQALASKVSLMSIGHQAIMDAYLCLLHLTTGIMAEPLFNAFATAAFFEFVIFAIFEMRYLLAIWRARRSASLDPWAVQRELSVLYARFYGALLGGIFLMFQLKRHVKVLVLLMHSFWVPQILLCVRTDSQQPLWGPFVVGMTLTRLALPLYLFGCPHNLLRAPPNYGLCALLVLHMGAQVGMLAAQSKYGPRCFIPRQFLPAKYNYFRPAALRTIASGGVQVAVPAGDIETGDAGAECVICMTPVDIERLKSRMVTPCNHFFHPTCLQRWMDIKMECPTCRRMLPPL